MRRIQSARALVSATACALLLAAASDRSAALTGAERMPPESFRFVAYVGDDYGYCTGAIIAPTWVLTAAHCVVKGDGSTIRPDEINDLSRGRPDDDWERVPVKRVISHPHYYWQGDGFRNDVALLETVRPFASSDLVPVEVLSLEDEALYAANGATAVMVGYGEDENGQRDRDGLFRMVSALLHDADSCRVEHSFVDAKGEIVHDGTICAGDRARGIRGGDSGGPLLVRTDDGAYGLVGIASISGHDRSGHPVVAVYTRVATVKDWIDGCVLGSGECIEGGVKLTELKRHDPDEIRESETLEQRSTAIVFVNDTVEAFSYHWIDFNGNERYYGSVGPGESISQHTFPGHVWAVKDASARTFAIFVAEEETGRALVSDNFHIVVDDEDGGESVADERVEGDADSAWVKLNLHNEFDYHAYMDLNEETTPGTWGGCDLTTLNKPSYWCGSWAVYRTDDGTVVQVAAWGSESYPTYTGAGWRVRGGSGWDAWYYGTGPLGIDIGSKAPRQMDIEAAPAGPVTIVQASQLDVPMPRGDSPWIDSISESEWLSTWMLMVHDEVAGTQTVVQCDNGCRAWQRTPPSTVAVERDTPVHDDGAIETKTHTVPDFTRDRIARVLDKALAATTWNVHGSEVPDWTTRLRALGLVIEIFGSPVEIGDGSAHRTPPSTVEEVPKDMTELPEAKINIPEPMPLSPAVRDRFKLDSFYQQWIDVQGLPVVASPKVNPYAIREAAWLIKQMIGHRPDVLRTLSQNGVRYAVMAHDELTTDVPEHSDLVPAGYWNRRARGLGPTLQRPATSSGEENLLAYPGDPYRSESILIHEFSHAIHEMGLNVVDPDFDNRLAKAFNAAATKALWRNTYAITNKEEYWAEGAQSWFDANRENDAEHNHVNTREELKTYDPTLAALLAQVFGNREWRYTPATDRTSLPFLHGFDPQQSPTFEWPSELMELTELQSELLTPDSDGDDSWVELKRYDPDQLHNPKSTLSRVETAIIFVNDTEGEVSYLWIDFNGEEVRYGSVSPGEFANQHTFQGHVWVVKDARGKALAVFRAEEGAGRALVCMGCPFEPIEPGAVVEWDVVEWVGPGFDQLCNHIKNGKLDEVDRLVQAGADLNSRSGYYETAIFCAHTPRVLRHLVEKHGGDPNGSIRDGEHLDTPICMARTLEMAQEFVRLGAVVRGRGDESQTLVHCATYYGTEAAHIEWAVVDLRIDIEKRSETGWTPLCVAAKYRTFVQVNELLRLGADPNRNGGDPGRPEWLHPLSCAQEHGNPVDRDRNTQVLLAAGAARRSADDQ